MNKKIGGKYFLFRQLNFFKKIHFLSFFIFSGESSMVYSNNIVNQLAIRLLEGLCIQNPTHEQHKAAECFVAQVILPITAKDRMQGHLTPKEWLCLNLAASGFSTEETADRLALAHGTIKNYRERIRRKLHCKSMAQAVYKAFGQAEDHVV
jgi:DNA-binding NarL/FixJ family response regulator